MTDVKTRMELGKEVGDYLDDERRKAMDKMGLTFVRLIKELKPIALSDIADYVTVSEDGSLQSKPTASIKKGKRPAIKSIKEHTRITESADGEKIWKDSRVEFILHDKLSAITTLLKLGGHFPGEKIEGTVKHEHGLTPELQAIHDEIMNRGGRGKD